MKNYQTPLSSIAKTILFLSFLIGPALGTHIALAEQAKPLTAEERDQVTRYNEMLRRAVEQALPAVVSIQVTKQVEGNAFEMNPFVPQQDMQPHEVPGIGSGVIIDKKGYVITNNHVVADTDKITVVLGDGRSFEAKDKFLDPDTDLAIVKIDPKDQDLPVAIIGDSDKLEVGNTVLAMGAPFGFTQTVTCGIVSFKGRQTHILDMWGYEDFIQTDADISKGNSGGPLVNLYGEVVGINSNILSQTGISSGYGFSIPSNLVKFVSEQLIANGMVKRGWLGIQMRSLGDLRKLPKEALKEVLKDHQGILDGIPDTLEGVLVIEVNKNQPADKAGMKSKDVILSINDRKTTETNVLRNYIAMLPPGSVAKCKVWRDGSETTLDITLADRDIAKEREIAKAKKATDPRLKSFESQSAQKGKLGIAPKELTPELAKKFGYPEDTKGVLIDHVVEGSLADTAGLKGGDVILKADGEAVESIGALRKIISQADLDEKGLTLDILNDQGTKQIVIKQTPNL